LGLSTGDQALVATAISELARNIVDYAKRGEIILELAEHEARRGMVVIARDEGPGIPDVERAMQDGYSTGNGLGLGLPGVRRLMDEFEIVSQVGKGTTITAKKWAR
jgi:serine/threonine-protein kinase RsbT